MLSLERDLVGPTTPRDPIDVDAIRSTGSLSAEPSRHRRRA